MQAPRTDQQRRWLARILAGVLIGASLIALALAARSYWQAKASADWPQVQAIVVQSEIERNSDSKGQTRYRPRVSYRYQIEGREILGDRIYFGESSFLLEADAREVVAPYPVGATVTASYDPGDADSAVLEPGRARNLTWLLVIGLAFGIPGVLVAFLAPRNAR